MKKIMLLIFIVIGLLSSTSYYLYTRMVLHRDAYLSTREDYSVKKNSYDQLFRDVSENVYYIDDQGVNVESSDKTYIVMHDMFENMFTYKTKDDFVNGYMLVDSLTVDSDFIKSFYGDINISQHVIERNSLQSKIVSFSLVRFTNEEYIATIFVDRFSKDNKNSSEIVSDEYVLKINVLTDGFKIDKLNLKK